MFFSTSVTAASNFMEITERLKNNGIKYIYLRNFNQDPLENFFGSIRSLNYRNINPNPLQFQCLWIRISVALAFPLPLQDHFQEEVWKFILSYPQIISFYVLPIKREKLKVFDRLEFVDTDAGFPSLPAECPFTTYKYNAINIGGIRGSCEYFNERQKIEISTIKDLSLQEAITLYGETLVMVASQEYRDTVLFPQNVQKPNDLTDIQYCILQEIARGRYNGQVTCGVHSVTTFIKEYCDLFYVKLKLMSMQLIAKEPYTERLTNRICSGHILTLPRFHTPFKTRPVVVIEAVYNLIVNNPANAVEIESIKDKLPFDCFTYKKLNGLPHFKKYFEAARIPYRRIYPDADISQWRSKKTQLERQLNVIRLKDSKTTLEQILENSEIQSENDQIEFLTDSHYFIDMPFIEQVYRFIAKHGVVGCSQMQILRYMAISRYTVRQLVKRLLEYGIIKEYSTDVGRQRIKMFMTANHINVVENMTKGSTPKEMLEKMKSDEFEVSELMNSVSTLDNITLNYDANPSKIDKLNQVTATFKESEPPCKNLKKINDSKTVRTIQRKQIIISILNKQFFIEKTNLQKHIISEEGKSGHKDQICAKSMYRIINWMIHYKLVRFFELTLKINKYVKLIRYVTHPKLEPEHIIVQNEIWKQKSAMLITVEERDSKKLYSQNTKIKRQILKDIEKVEKKKTIRDYYVKTPKFLTARFLQEYIYYLIYEQSPDAEPTSQNENIRKLLIQSYPNYDMNCLEGDLGYSYYEDNLSWKLFVRPLPLYKDKAKGWAYIMDIYLRMPLSIIMKLFQIDKDCNATLNEYLNHPIKQHFLVHKLPVELQELIFKFRVGRVFISILKNLNWIGLIQVSKRHLRDPKESWIYLNRNAKILDTTISEPSFLYISSNKTYEEIYFTFNTSQDVQHYWNTLYKICLTTKLGVRKDVEHLKRVEKEFLQSIEFEEATERDVGYIPGDHRGAAGLDSSLFGHFTRNWSWHVKLKKKPTGKSPRNIKIHIHKDQTKSGNESKSLKVNLKTNKLKLVAGRRIPIKRKVLTRAIKKKRTEYDKIDKEALKNMDSLRVTWSKDEDNMLKVCRAVYIFLNTTVAQLQRAINSYTYRDILHWSLNSINKTSKACQRRLRYMLKTRPSPDVMTWVHELKQNPHIKQRFGANVLLHVREMYKDDSEFMEMLKILFVKLVYYMNKIIKNSQKPTENQCILPDTLNQLYRCYKEITPINSTGDIVSVRELSLKHRDPESIEDVEISTINSIMHSTMCCIRDKTLYNIQIFEVYKKYQEETLAKAFKKAREDNLVVQLKTKPTSPSGKIAPITGSSLVLSVKYKQQMYLDIPYEAIDLCYQQFIAGIQTFFKVNNGSNTIDMKTVNAGAFYYLIEMTAKNNILIDVQLPQKILTIDPNQQPSSVNDSERILDHFHMIFDNAPKTEYLKYFEEDSENSSPRVKFSKTNENYKLIYNPYDILAKLSDDYLHFYCALDNLHDILDLDFARFPSDSFCPFNCILKNSNIINAVEKILHEKKSVIEDLIRNPEVEEIIESIIILNPKNLMQVFTRLQNTLRERNLSFNQKDFGKLRMDRSTTVDILQLSKDILEHTDNEKANKLEFEPSINKEEKIIRAQDLFVVNLPTLKISCIKDEMDKTKDSVIVYKDAIVPEKMVKNSLNREEILKKILSLSHWCHNGNIEILKQSSIYKKLSNYEHQFIDKVYRFIETFEMGAPAQILADTFKDEKVLTKVCTILRRYYLIMRVGVENFIYVHKNQISSWVIHTYNIKRLDRESLQDSTVILNTEGQKRKLEDEAGSSKSVKKQILETEDGKRVSKPVERFEPINETSNKKKHHTVKEKENVIIRPFPWIRINGSLNRRVLDKWIGSILIDCLLNSGQSILTICKRFNQLHPMNVRCLLEILQDLDCIKLKVFKPRKNITLFSNYDESNEEEDATEFSRIDQTFITSQPNAMVNLGIFIGDKKYNMDFV